jgi:hypothetical protein
VPGVLDGRATKPSSGSAVPGEQVTPARVLRTGFVTTDDLGFGLDPVGLCWSGAWAISPRYQFRGLGSPVRWCRCKLSDGAVYPVRWNGARLSGGAGAC